MKTFVVAQHHGSFLTIKSLGDLGIDDVTIIIPGSQVVKYNKMYEDNPTNKEFVVFKDYDKRIAEFVKSNNLNYKVFVFDDFDVRNTIASTINAIKLTEYRGVVSCIMSGAIAIKDYRDFARSNLNCKEIGTCLSRVYQFDKHLAMYGMIGLPAKDMAVDTNFFVVDMSKASNLITLSDSQLLNNAIKRKQLTYLDRNLNHKSDILIGSAISARQTVSHNLRAQNGYILNFWNKAIMSPSKQTTEEIFGYPYHFYKKVAANMQQWIPESTVSRIVLNGTETENVIGGLHECMDIIDL